MNFLTGSRRLFVPMANDLEAPNLGNLVVVFTYYEVRSVAEQSFRHSISEDDRLR